MHKLNTKQVVKQWANNFSKTIETFFRTCHFLWLQSLNFKIRISGTCLVVQWLRLLFPLQGMRVSRGERVQSLIGELRSCVPTPGLAKKKTITKTNETLKLRISFKGTEYVFGTQKRDLIYKAFLFSLPFDSWSNNPESSRRDFYCWPWLSC